MTLLHTVIAGVVYMWAVGRVYLPDNWYWASESDPYARLCHMPLLDPPPGEGGGGGGGYFHMYAYWVCAARETPIFSAEFPFRSISFSQITKKSVPEHHHFNFFAGFCLSGDHHFQFFFISTCSSSPTAGSARTQSIWQRRGLAAGQSASQTRSGSSGDSHFHASKRIKLVPEPRISMLDRELDPEQGPIFHFAAAHTYQNLGWVPPPPPPPPGSTSSMPALWPTRLLLLDPPAARLPCGPLDCYC